VPGDRLDLGGGVEFVITEALILDLPNTQWGYVPSAKTLFTTDGFCYMHHPELDDEDPMHLPGECGLTTSELSAPPSVENAAFFSGSALYWARFIDDADERYARVIQFVRDIGVEVLCPTHGNVITDVEEVMAIVQEGHKRS
jgi:flavorubredoxin